MERALPSPVPAAPVSEHAVAVTAEEAPLQVWAAEQQAQGAAEQQAQGAASAQAPERERLE